LSKFTAASRGSPYDSTVYLILCSFKTESCLRR